jgi:hypothetical protein
LPQVQVQMDESARKIILATVNMRLEMAVNRACNLAKLRDKAEKGKDTLPILNVDDLRVAFKDVHNMTVNVYPGPECETVRYRNIFRKLPHPGGSHFKRLVMVRKQQKILQSTEDRIKKKEANRQASKVARYT